VSSPSAGKPLSAAQLAADFGPRTPHAQEIIGAIGHEGRVDAVQAYYSLLLDCLAARATGAVLPLAGLAAPLVRRLSEYTLPPEPEDLLKDLYLQLFPREVRHVLGEYYTPDWLAEKLLTATLGRDLGDPSRQALDPACGSGTFLVLLIKHIRRRVASGAISPRRALEFILRNVTGCDVHPLAVQAARTNYLLALGDLLRFTREPVDIPVYEADSILCPPSRLTESCDFLIGNPPWINWQHLSEDQRCATMPLWQHYSLFPKRRHGMQTILGAAKYDLSMLMIYAAADRFLRPGGRLGFIISQTLLKSSAGQGFRRFRLPDGTPLCVCGVEDLVKLKPFDSAANRTATLVLEKGRETEYPVEYLHHTAAAQHSWRAQPISADRSSPWISAAPATLAALTRILGPSPYRAREGVNTGGANAVFWIDVQSRSRCLVKVRNVTEGARNTAASTRATLEAPLVYALLRGRSVARWSAVAEHSILLTHRPGMKLRAIPEAEMRRDFPRAWAYLKRFEPMLRRRPAYKRYFRQDAPFYSMFNIGDYTFAPWKVVWREQALPFTAAVVGPSREALVIADHKLMIMPTGSEAEAHYLCGALNSLPVSAAVAAYTVETQIDTHVLEHVAVPPFDAGNPVHRALASASRRAHRAVEGQDGKGLQRAELALNRAVARLWSLADSELADMRVFLREAGLERT